MPNVLTNFLSLQQETESEAAKRTYFVNEEMSPEEIDAVMIDIAQNRRRDIYERCKQGIRPHSDLGKFDFPVCIPDDKGVTEILFAAWASHEDLAFKWSEYNKNTDKLEATCDEADKKIKEATLEMRSELVHHRNEIDRHYKNVDRLTKIITTADAELVTTKAQLKGHKKGAQKFFGDLFQTHARTQSQLTEYISEMFVKMTRPNQEFVPEEKKPKRKRGDIDTTPAFARKTDKTVNKPRVIASNTKKTAVASNTKKTADASNTKKTAVASNMKNTDVASEINKKSNKMPRNEEETRRPQKEHKQKTTHTKENGAISDDRHKPKESTKLQGSTSKAEKSTVENNGKTNENTSLPKSTDKSQPMSTDIASKKPEEYDDEAFLQIPSLFKKYKDEMRFKLNSSGRKWIINYENGDVSKVFIEHGDNGKTNYFIEYVRSAKRKAGTVVMRNRKCEATKVILKPLFLYECSVCTNKFQTSSDKNEHMRKVHQA